MRILKPKNWHLYSEEMKTLWWKTDYPKMVKDNQKAQKQFNNFIEEIKSGSIKNNEIDF